MRDIEKKIALNALTIVTEIGKPTLFITGTVNVNWPEIQSRLLKGQIAFDRITLFYMDPYINIKMDTDQFHIFEVFDNAIDFSPYRRLYLWDGSHIRNKHYTTFIS